jgi:hypothetical protein
MACEKPRPSLKAGKGQRDDRHPLEDRRQRADIVGRLQHHAERRIVLRVVQRFSQRQ